MNERLAELQRDISPAALWLMGLWLLTMVSVPIVRWSYGDVILPWIASCTVVVQAATVIMLLVGDIGIRQTMRLSAAILVGTWAVERIGSHTGYPFGEYAYTERLQPQVGDVPLLVPLAWLMMLPPAWAVAQVLAGHERQKNPDTKYARAYAKGRIAGFLVWTFRPHLLVYVLVSGLAITAWDLFLDPQMVAWQFWQWQTPGAYFGIPLINYIGWFGTGVLLTLLARPPALDVTPYLLIYGATWLLQSMGLAIFWSMPGPALCGFVAMGILVILAWRRVQVE